MGWSKGWPGQILGQTAIFLQNWRFGAFLLFRLFGPTSTLSRAQFQAFASSLFPGQLFPQILQRLIVFSVVVVFF